MARYLDNQYASASVLQPIKKGTIQFLQDAWKNALADFIIAFVGRYTPGDFYSTTTAYVLYGCIDFFGNLSSGAIFFNGEVYEFAGGTYPSLGTGQVAVMTILTTPYTTDADPTYFSDQSPHYVHNIRTIQIIAGTPGGSGVSNYVADFSNAIFLDIDLPNMNFLISQAQSSIASEITRATGAESVNSTNIANEITRAEGIEGGLQTQINAIESAFSSVNLVLGTNVAVLIGGSISNVSGTMKYEIINKKIRLAINLTCRLYSPEQITINLPDEASWKYTVATMGLYDTYAATMQIIGTEGANYVLLQGYPTVFGNTSSPIDFVGEIFGELI